MATLNYTMTVTVSETEGELQAPLESATLKTLFEQIISQFNLRSGMAKLDVTTFSQV